MSEAEFNPCGECSKCCQLLSVQADDGGLFSPFLKWCQHAVRPGGGCAIYKDRPQSCRTFICLYAASQRGLPGQDVMPPEMRPDRCGVIFGPPDPADPERIYNVHCDPQRPMAWARRDVRTWIERIVGRGITVVLSVGTKHTTLRRDLENMHVTRSPQHRPGGMRSA